MLLWWRIKDRWALETLALESIVSAEGLLLKLKFTAAFARLVHTRKQENRTQYPRIQIYVLRSTCDMTMVYRTAVQHKVDRQCADRQYSSTVRKSHASEKYCYGRAHGCDRARG